jgi:Beta-lactamase superfamily domain
LGRRPSFLSVGCDNLRVEIVSFGDTCLRLRGREGVVAADAFPRIVGPTGRGMTADIATYSHADGQQSLGLSGKGGSGNGRAGAGRASSGRALRRVPTSLESAFLLDSPGEFEVHEVLINGIRTYRDEVQGAERGPNTCFVYELDGVHVVHLGDIGHLLSEAALDQIGPVEVVCVPVGGSLAPARAAELVAQFDANLVVPMAIGTNGQGSDDLARFLHEMSVQHEEPVPKLTVTSSSAPNETTVVLLETRGRS